MLGVFALNSEGTTWSSQSLSSEKTGDDGKNNKYELIRIWCIRCTYKNDSPYFRLQIFPFLLSVSRPYYIV